MGDLSPSRLPPSHTRLCVAHVLKGIAHMHSLDLYHGDLKPANVLMHYGEQLHFVVADLGAIVEVGRGVMRIAGITTTLWYRSPEILDGQRSAVGDHWLRADVWALGITMAQVCGLEFFKVDPRKMFAAKMLQEALWFAVGASPGADWPRFLRDTIGQVGVDLLADFLVWKPEGRPISASRINNPFFYPK